MRKLETRLPELNLAFWFQQLYFLLSYAKQSLLEVVFFPSLHCWYGVLICVQCFMNNSLAFYLKLYKTVKKLNVTYLVLLSFIFLWCISDCMRNKEEIYTILKRNFTQILPIHNFCSLAYFKAPYNIKTSQKLQIKILVC